MPDVLNIKSRFLIINRQIFKAEISVKIMKNMIRKCQESKDDFQLALLNWRNTPTESMNSSPVQRIFARRTKTITPMTRQLLEN